MVRSMLCASISLDDARDLLLAFSSRRSAAANEQFWLLRPCGCAAAELIRRTRKTVKSVAVDIEMRRRWLGVIALGHPLLTDSRRDLTSLTFFSKRLPRSRICAFPVSWD